MKLPKLFSHDEPIDDTSFRLDDLEASVSHLLRQRIREGDLEAARLLGRWDPIGVALATLEIPIDK